MDFVGPPHRIERARAALIPLGWTDAFEDAYLAHPEALDTMPGRVVRQEKTWLRVHTAHGQVHAMASGRLRHRTRMASDFPVIGDWVLVSRRPVLGRDERTQVIAVLARATLLARKEPGQAHNAQASGQQRGRRPCHRRERCGRHRTEQD
jgi:ribosome biogenesis GTPase